MSHAFPDDSPAMWAELEHQTAGYPDDRPDPADYLGLTPVSPLPGCDECGSPWQPPLCRCDVLCDRCGNEVRRNETICRECADDILAEQAHDRGRPGEWDR